MQEIKEKSCWILKLNFIIDKSRSSARGERARDRWRQVPLQLIFTMQIKSVYSDHVWRSFVRQSAASRCATVKINFCRASLHNSVCDILFNIFTADIYDFAGRGAFPKYRRSSADPRADDHSFGDVRSRSIFAVQQKSTRQLGCSDWRTERNPRRRTGETVESANNYSLWLQSTHWSHAEFDNYWSVRLRSSKCRAADKLTFFHFGWPLCTNWGLSTIELECFKWMQ